ncbi:MAG: hypothetical protein HY706_06925 [Candidatus Hydrogenedentes bacterium]|nr:hypothetical protein [Candidatus Hydrogenedentota bacterium]
MKNTVHKLFEDVFIFLAILSLWPWILGYRTVWYWVYAGAILIGLAVIAIIRVRRFRRVVEPGEESEDSGSSLNKAAPLK